ncbi:MAG TPA: LemA family protein [Desulfovibrio sp.]|uniref:LemA family protein n=1 Tax=Desulfovibrio sp. TaxID=885 RepID=UPI002B9EBB1D|nr:LemA family protein [Desulfovibrio sp.]HMM39333.1 LemA family protein [Desulfovibrio sp.]
MTILYILLGATGLVLLWLVLVYNRLVRGRNMVREAWSGIDVQLKRRADLIPNLVETVKGYAGHEQAALARVTELRAKSLSGGGAAEQGRVQAELSRALAGIFAVAEAYPDLKADASFRQLQGELTNVEEHVQLARRYYNGAARDLNIAVESFPNNLVAGAFGFQTVEYFELEDAADRAVPDVSFK